MDRLTHSLKTDGDGLIKDNLSLLSLNSRVIKGEGGVGAGECRGSVAEHWWLKPEVLSLTSGSTTCLSLLFKRSSDRNDSDCL